MSVIVNSMMSITVARSWIEVGNDFDLAAFCETEILVQVERHRLGPLPPVLAEKLLTDALAK